MMPETGKAKSGSKYAEKLVVFATELRKKQRCLGKKPRKNMCYMYKKSRVFFVNRKQ